MNTFPVCCGFRRTMTSIAIHRLFLLIVTVTAFTLSALAQDIQKLDPALEQLVGPDSKLERIATGFNKWTEAPVWPGEPTFFFPVTYIFPKREFWPINIRLRAEGLKPSRLLP